MILLVLSLACLFCVINGNTALPDSWTPVPYGECTYQPIEEDEFVSPPYTGDNADPYIAEGVGSGSQGVTCSFEDSYSSYMPNIWQQHYLLAASQDIYAGMIFKYVFV